MTDPLTLASLSNSVLTQGIAFVYTQVGELLKRHRDGRQHADPPEPAAEVPPLDGALAPLVADYSVSDQLAEEMAGLYRILSDYYTDKKPVTVEDAELLRTVDALRGLLEAVYGQRFTFRDEDRPPSGPVVAGEIDVDEVRGYAAAVRVEQVSGSARIEAQAKVTQVKKGGRVVGAEIKRIG